jgi:hypothetical protein
MRIAPCLIAVGLLSPAFSLVARSAAAAQRATARAENPPPADEPSPEDAAPSWETARLHVDGPRFTDVLGRPRGDTDWTVVCAAPCDAPAPVAWEYQTRRRGMKPSPVFQLDAIAGETAVVHVHPAYSAWFTGGVAVMATGALGLSVAVLGLPVAMFESVSCGFHDAGSCVQQYFEPLGVLALAGAGLVAVGALAAAPNLSTTVTQDGAATAAPALPEPAWARREGSATGTPSIAAPLLTLRF